MFEVLTFEDLVKKNQKIQNIGGKAFHLIQIIEKGHNIPPGILLTTQTFTQLLSLNKIHKFVEELILDLKQDVEYEKIKQTSTKIRNLIESIQIPEELEIKIMDMTNEKESYAVRSSSIFEDSKEFSFAGYFESFLNVNKYDLIKHIKIVWSSLFNVNAISYLLENKIKGDEILDSWISGMCVIIQKQIESEKSGVMFTANPKNGNRNRILIDSNYGLGDLLVNGKVNPDSYEIKKPSLSISKKCGEKFSKSIGSKEGFTEVVPNSKEDQIKFVLSDDEIKDLCNIGVNIESVFGNTPQDIEWCIENKKIYILQCRPINGLFPVITHIPKSLKDSILRKDLEPLKDQYFRVYWSLNDATVIFHLNNM
jgi:phosphoenolpyruvate synthase/pyruvate phosphate dikinase